MVKRIASAFGENNLKKGRVVLSTGRRILILAAAVGVLVLPPARPCPAASAGPTVTIGVASSLGILEGQESLEAVKLAVAQLNAAGGIRLQGKKRPVRVAAVDLYDAIPDVPVADVLATLERFITRAGVHALVVGPFRSEVLLAAMDLIARYRLPTLVTIAMSPALDSKILRDPAYRYLFRVGLNAKYLVGYLIDTMTFLNQRFGFHRVYLMHQDVAWTRSTASMMTRLFFDPVGWPVVGMDHYPSKATDFTASLARAQAGGAQIILPLFDAPGSANLVRQWHAMKAPALLCGFVSPMVGGGAWKAFDGKTAGTLNAVFELGNIPSRIHQPAQAFFDAFRQRYGRPIEAGHGPAPSYEAVYILAEAIGRADSVDPQALVTALEATDRIGAMGRIRFHPGHQAIFGQDPDHSALGCVFQWTGSGRRQIVHPPSIAEGQIQLPEAVTAVARAKAAP
jgi:branched-chain amino acid transport system substrate-binding protein